MPASLSHRAQTIKQAKRSYSERGRPMIPEVEERQLARGAELVERSERIRAVEVKKRVNKEQRERKEAGDREARKRQGLPDVPPPKVREGQLQLTNPLYTISPDGSADEVKDEERQPRITGRHIRKHNPNSTAQNPETTTKQKLAKWIRREYGGEVEEIESFDDDDDNFAPASRHIDPKTLQDALHEPVDLMMPKSDDEHNHIEDNGRPNNDIGNDCKRPGGCAFNGDRTSLEHDSGDIKCNANEFIPNIVQVKHSSSHQKYPAIS
ncbi:hypothetical protein MMC25_003059 [Agyrium rufum]|nr:hypothetical protein [Agyrium rufum]